MKQQQEGAGSCLEWIFKTPQKLEFSKLYRYYFDFILRLLYRVILIEEIPKTVNETFLKMILYTCGKVCFLNGKIIGENGEELLALNCSRSDTPDVYYMPTKALVTNPRLKKSYMLTPGEECEVVYLSETDKYNLSGLHGGLYALIQRTATMLADNDISINTAQKNTRLVNILAADTQNTYDSIKAVIAKMYDGEPTIVVKKSLVDTLQGVPILASQPTDNLVQLIQTQQYIISHFYEQIGLTTHDNMKKERLITAEINDNIDLAIFNIDDILESIQEGLDRVNAMFRTNMSARLNPIIERQREEAAAAEEEAAPEEEPEPQSEKPAAEEPEEEAAPEEEAPEEEPEPQSEEPAAEEPEEEAAPEESNVEQSEINLEISGDNNTIIIGGGESIVSTDEDEPEDMGHDNEDGARGD